MEDEHSAHSLLRRWCSRRGRIQELADEHGVSRSTVHRWVSGETLPTMSARVLLERRIGIPRTLWRRA